MSKKKLFLILTFICLLFIKIFSMEKIDLYYPLLPEATEFKGNIYLRDVKNESTYLKSKNDINYIGVFTEGVGWKPIASSINVLDMVRGMVTNSLEYSGYKVINENLKNNNISINGMNIDEFIKKRPLVKIK